MRLSEQSLRLARTAGFMSSIVVMSSFHPPTSFKTDMRHTPAVPVPEDILNGKNSDAQNQFLSCLVTRRIIVLLNRTCLLVLCVTVRYAVLCLWILYYSYMMLTISCGFEMWHIAPLFFLIERLENIVCLIAKN
jgi:hypothetical protein